RREVAQCLVRTPGVVTLKPIPQTGFQFAQGGVLAQVDFLVIHAPPQTFYEHVVHPAALAVHTDGNAQLGEPPSPFLARKLAALIGVEYLWYYPTVAGDGLLQRPEAKRRVHGVRQPPAERLSRIPVHDRAQIRVA